jgi:hypothetical protein
MKNQRMFGFPSLNYQKKHWGKFVEHVSTHAHPMNNKFAHYNK